MEKWLFPRDKKESRSCFSCEDYKMKAQFYDWHSHPALKTIINKYHGAICSKCARREAGSNHFNRINRK